MAQSMTSTLLLGRAIRFSQQMPGGKNTVTTGVASTLLIRITKHEGRKDKHLLNE